MQRITQRLLPQLEHFWVFYGSKFVVEKYLLHAGIIPYNERMAHDDDSDGFLGTTFIPHGNSHSHSVSENDAEATTPKPTEEKPKKKPASAESTEKLERRIQELEAELQAYEANADERLKHLERMAGHPISDAERAFRIQEDS